MKFLMKLPRRLLIISLLLVHFGHIGAQTCQLVLHLEEQVGHGAGEDQIPLVCPAEHLTQAQLLENGAHQKLTFLFNCFVYRCGDELLVSGD